MIIDPLTVSILVQLYVKDRITFMSLRAIHGQRLDSKNQALTFAISSSVV